MRITTRPLRHDDPSDVMIGAASLANRIVADYDAALDPETEDGFRAQLRGNATFEHVTILATADGVPVGLAQLLVHDVEGNEDKAEVMVGVDPDHRHHGVGRALLAATLDVCDERGRTGLIGYAVNTDDAERFWSSAGASLGQIERESRLWLADTDRDMMTDWVDRRRERAGDYTVVHWRGDTPAHLLEASAALVTGMNDAPLDGLDYDDDVWTADDVAALDRYQQLRDVETLASMVLAPDGAPAGLTVVRTTPHRPRFGRQGDTIVLADHRNRGIGRWLKAEMWLRLQREQPDLEAIDTENAESNDPMLAINVAMGFRPLVAVGVWQADVATLRAGLAQR